MLYISNPREHWADVLVVGGGIGGCAAAMAAAAMGKRVILTEDSDWLGGQLTSQAVPPDEHCWIETHGCTQRYRRFRQGIRQYYRSHYPLTEAARLDLALNPGLADVSTICHEPAVAVAVLDQMLAEDRAAERLTVLSRRIPVAASVVGDRVAAITLRSLDTGDEEVISATYILDATELGDLLPLAGIEYVTGAESQAETAEPHAVTGPAQPDNVQSLTWSFPVSYDPTGGSHVIDRPAQYDRWRAYVPPVRPAWPGRLLDWTHADPITLAPRRRTLFVEETDDPFGSLWRYRRILASDHFDPGNPPHETTLVNWPQNDYLGGNIIDQPPDVVQRYLEEARQLSLSLLYWMQTEAPRPDGGTGYPGLYLRPDLVGSPDGLAKKPYVRESRRIRALTTVTELDIGAEARGTPTARFFDDSVGVGSYRIDLHPSTGGNNYIDIDSLPFQIPLGALIPVRVENVLPACKNIGVTHIANGCYRLHPVEWNVGEAAGFLAGFCIDRGLQPREVREVPKHLYDFQRLLRDEGIELAWPTCPTGSSAAHSCRPAAHSASE
jgi:hypothetical protein